jgi:hypothetical protein
MKSSVQKFIQKQAKQDTSKQSQKSKTILKMTFSGSMLKPLRNSSAARLFKLMDLKKQRIIMVMVKELKLVSKFSNDKSQSLMFHQMGHMM